MIVFGVHYRETGLELVVWDCEWVDWGGRSRSCCISCCVCHILCCEAKRGQFRSDDGGLEFGLGDIGAI